MESVANEAQAGINSLIAEQFAMDGKLTITLAKFDNEFETVERMSAKPFTFTLRPRGMTALLDAVGMEVTRTGKDLAGLADSERPGRVLLVVVTDGHENSSHEYSLEQVRSMLAIQKEHFNWEVQFLGADEAAWQGAELGVATTRYANTRSGNVAVFASMSESMTTYRAAPSAEGFSMPEEITTG
ncbi:hypothetical protein ASG91_00115 [Phycicoccus sp. Soil802]|nr:hypothetical protein ASG91_00115 [Phycicoccus sp. Soil802]